MPRGADIWRGKCKVPITDRQPQTPNILSYKGGLKEVHLLMPTDASLRNLGKGQEFDILSQYLHNRTGTRWLP